MASLNIPNDILDGARVEAIDHQQNYQEIETFVNGSVIHADGSVAMSGPLLLGATATAPLEAVGKAQMDAGDAAAVSSATSTASGDATTKADAALAAAKVYSDANNIETSFVQDLVPVTRSTTTSPQTVLSTSSITAGKTGYFIVTATLDANLQAVGSGGVAAAFIGDLTVDGVVQQGEMIWQPMGETIGARHTLSKTWIVAQSSTNDATAFVARCRHAGGGTGGGYDVSGVHCTLQALFIG